MLSVFRYAFKVPAPVKCCLNVDPALNPTPRLAASCNTSPVAGFRPSRAARSLASNVPKPARERSEGVEGVDHHQDDVNQSRQLGDSAPDVAGGER